MVAPKLMSGRKKKRLRAFVMVAAADVPAVPLPGRLTEGGWNCPVVIAPMVLVAPVLKILIPSCFSRLRSTLAKRTFRRICGGVGGTSTYMRFTTLPAVVAI